MKNFFAHLKNKPAHWYLLLAIMVLAVFLRTYHHGDWLRFNADQSRDATVVSNFLDGKSSLPLLGPKAGGTEFKLGGAFYYLQIASAALFGNSPEKMAYPDLVAGILTIPLLYFLAKRYFNTSISLILAFVGSFCVYLVKYARFAWNPNSGPFYTFLLLYALLMLADNKATHKKWWILAAGFAMGVGVQLHTLLLVIMPAVTIIFFVYVAKQNPTLWKKAAAIFAIALLLNVGQIVSELQTGGANTQAFLGGANSKTGRSSSILDDVLQVSSCQIQSDAFIVSGLGDNDQCGTKLITDGYTKAHGTSNKIIWMLGLLASVLFTLGGTWLWVKAFRKEKVQDKKNVLLLTGVWALIGFALLIPLAKDLVTIRYYLAMTFVPFMLLGFWLKLLWEQRFSSQKYVAVGIGIIVAVFAWVNLSQIKASFADYANKKQISGATKSEITLGETQFIANYIMAHANPKGTVLVEGKQKYLFKYVRSIEYFTRQKNIKVAPLSKNTNPTPDTVIVSLGNAKNKGKLSSKLAEVYEAKDVKIYGRFSILELLKK